ncbi:MAG: hypothetical protein PIR02_06550 [Microbacterium enclense]
MTTPLPPTVVGAGSLARPLLPGWVYEPRAFSRVTAALLERSGEDAGERRSRVTSPDGVTYHALEGREPGDFGGLVGRSVAAGPTRTTELASGTKGSS